MVGLLLFAGATVLIWSREEWDSWQQVQGLMSISCFATLCVFSL